MINNYLKLFKRSPKRVRKLTYSLAAASFLLVGGVVTLGIKIHNLEAPALSAEDKVLKAVQEVGAAMILPTDEVPTVAIVAAPEKLQGQAFFAQAQIGDELLIYKNSKKAILWRPSVKKVVDVSALSVTSTGSGSSTATNKGN